jgi:dipeptidyl aminopeptidase/acylaminoacyl peptidase
VVSRGGRPDLAGDALPRVKAPTLLIVGENDPQVLALNRAARLHLRSADTELAIIPRATHLFEEPGALAKVSRVAEEWFDKHLATELAGSAAG